MTGTVTAELERTAPPRAGLAAVNPVARILAVVPLAVALVLTLDVVSAGLALVLELLLLPFTGIGWRRFWRASAVLWIAAPLSALTILFYGRASGSVWLSLGLIHMTSGSALLSVATLLRVLAIALPSIVVLVGVDPTDLADGLGQILRLPSRFVLGALAGVRTITLFRDDWHAIGLARRARGLGDGRGPVRVAGMSFALLVLALRRGGALATAMEARGFPAPGARTWARPSPFGRREWGVIVIGVAIAVLAVAAALVAGTWRFIGG